MSRDEDTRYAGVLEALGDIATEVRSHQAKIDSDWQIHRATVNAAIGLLSNELVRLQHIFDQFVGERKQERADDEAGRELHRRRADRFRWGILAAVLLLVVVNLLVLAFFIGRGAL